MTDDRRGLQRWYREAMLRRIDELVELRSRVEDGSTGACDQLRQIGQALRGSGGTFGFPEITSAAGIVETSTDAEALRRLEGLLVELRVLAGERRGEWGRMHEWLARSAGLPEMPEPGDAEPDDVGAAWHAVGEAAGLDPSALAQGVARRFDLAVADLTRPSRAAQRLVPEAFTMSEGIVPMVEDSTTITVASAVPVSLPVEAELRRLTGRRPIFAVAPPPAIDAVLTGATRAVGARTPAATQASADAPEAGEAVQEAAGPPVVAALGTAEDGGRAGVHGGESVAARRRHEREGPVGVLVVDDEASARLLVRTLLEKRGFETVEASDGIEALEVIREHDDIGLAVVDLNMPRMDGLELIWQLRDAGPWAELPVIVVTGERDEALETQIMEEGADDYIRKPVDPRLFLARVDATLRRTGHGSAA